MTHSDFYRLPSVSEALVQNQFPMLWGSDTGVYYFVIDIVRRSAIGPDESRFDLLWLILKDSINDDDTRSVIARDSEKLYRIPKDLTFQEIRLLRDFACAEMPQMDSYLAKHLKDDSQIALLSLVHRGYILQESDWFEISDAGYDYLNVNNTDDAEQEDNRVEGVDGDFDPDIHEAPAPSVETARKTKVEFKTFKGVLPKADGTLPGVGLPSAADDLTPVTIKPRSPLPEGAADDVNPQYVEGVPAHMLMPGDVIYLGAGCEVLVDVNVTENSVWLGFKTGNQKVLPKDRMVPRNMRGYHGTSSRSTRLSEQDEFEEVAVSTLISGNVVAYGDEMRTIISTLHPINDPLIYITFEGGDRLEMPYTDTMKKLVVK